MPDSTPTATPLDLRARVADIVAAYPECARVLSAHRIDFCCKGGIALAEACAQRGLDPAVVLADLESSRRDHEGRDEDLRALSTSALVARLVATHHAYLRDALPWIGSMAEKVARVHGRHDPRLAEVHAVVRDLSELLLRHLDDEERSLFPALEARATRPADVAPRLADMRGEHEEVGLALGRLRTLTDAHTPPGWACTTYRTLLAELAHLEADTHRHVHIENHVLAERFAEEAP